MSSNTEEASVVATVNHYLNGLRDAENAKEHIESAFYSSTNLHYVDENGNLQFMPRDALVQHAQSGEVPDHQSSILSVEVINEMALVKVQLDYPEWDYYDYLTLLKLNIGWRIVSKTFVTVMK